MKKRLCYLAALALLAPASLHAQQPMKPSTLPSAVQERRQLEEDVEILRRLLDRALISPRAVAFSPDGKILAIQNGAGTVRLWDSATYRPLRVAFSPEGKIVATKNSDGTMRLWDRATGELLSGPPETAPGLSGLEGVYLKGYGVVYTVTLPPPLHAAKPPAAKPAPKPLSDWERVRKELRGDKTEVAAPTPAAAPTLADTILRVLAQNGRHLTGLGPKEGVTVVVTFCAPRGPAVSARAAYAESGRPGGMASKGGSLPDMPGKPGMNSGMPGGPPSGIPGSPGMSPGMGNPSGSARQYELMGDLHLKQHRAREAAAAFEIALYYQKILGGSENTERTLCRKLALAYLAQTDLSNLSNPSNRAEVQKLVDRALEFLKRAQQSKSAEKAAPATHLPGKLIVSAPKSLLDAVGAGKLTFDEFRRAASVEAVPARTLEKPARGKPQ